jgi:hypothetical protein
LPSLVSLDFGFSSENLRHEIQVWGPFCGFF